MVPVTFVWYLSPNWSHFGLNSPRQCLRASLLLLVWPQIASASFFMATNPPSSPGVGQEWPLALASFGPERPQLVGFGSNWLFLTRTHIYIQSQLHTHTQADILAVTACSHLINSLVRIICVCAGLSAAPYARLMANSCNSRPTAATR